MPILSVAALILSGVLLASAVYTRSRAPAFADVADRSKQAVVNISSVQALKPAKEGPSSGSDAEPGDPLEDFSGPFLSDMPGERAQKSLGSGFLISSDGLIVTNGHLVEGAEKVVVRPSSTEDPASAPEYPAKVVGTDAKTDLALLKIEPREKMPSLAFGDSSRIRVGDWVIAIGNPFGLNQTVTAGIVSATGRVIGQGPYDDFIQTDASINPGSSGGPLLNLAGEVVGISMALVSGSGGNLGIAFATPSDVARVVVEQLRSRGKVVRGWLGITAQALTPELADSLHVPDALRDGVLVADVDPGSPAADAGVQRGDVIRSFDGARVDSWRNFAARIAEEPVGKTTELEVVREAKELRLTVKIGHTPDPERDEKAERSSHKDAGSNGPLGLLIEPLSDDAARKLQVDPGSGLLVAGVQPGSPGDEAGFIPGDIIREVERAQVDSTEELEHAVEAARGPSVLFLVRRNGSTQFVVAKKY